MHIPLPHDQLILTLLNMRILSHELLYEYCSRLTLSSNTTTCILCRKEHQSIFNQIVKQDGKKCTIMIEILLLVITISVVGDNNLGMDAYAGT